MKKAILIGTGQISHFHAKSLRKLGIEIAAVIGNDENSVSSFKSMYQIEKSFSSLEEVDISFDAVHILTPPRSHFKYASFCLKNDIDLICEKPLSLDLNQSKDLAKMAEGKWAAINFNNRYLDIVNTCKSSLDGRNIRAIMGHYHQAYHLLPAPYSWRYDSNQGGKMRAVTEIGSHYFDLISYITGLRVKEVFASFLNTKEKIFLSENKQLLVKENDGANLLPISVENEDIAYVIFRLENNALCNVSLSEISHGRNNEIVMDINTDKSSFILNVEQPYKLVEGKGFDMIEHSFSFSGGFENTFDGFFEDFYFKKQGKFASFRDGYENAKILETIYKSNNTKKWEEIY